MSSVVMHNVVSVDGYIADDKDDVGPLFEWYSNGDVDLAGGGAAKVSQASFDYVRPTWDAPAGDQLWFYALDRQPHGAWRLVGGGSGPWRRDIACRPDAIPSPAMRAGQDDRAVRSWRSWPGHGAIGTMASATACWPPHAPRVVVTSALPCPTSCAAATHRTLRTQEQSPGTVQTQALLPVSERIVAGRPALAG